MKRHTRWKREKHRSYWRREMNKAARHAQRRLARMAEMFGANPNPCQVAMLELFGAKPHQMAVLETVGDRRTLDISPRRHGHQIDALRYSQMVRDSPEKPVRIWSV